MTETSNNQLLPDDEVRVIPAERVRVWEDEKYVLHVAVDDTVYSKVRAVKAFPLTNRVDYISFLDEKNKEVVLLEGWERLSPDSRAALERVLARMYYRPYIRKVLSITETVGISRWDVITNQGYAQFEIADRKQIRPFSGGRYVITDAEGNRFEIPDVHRLDPKSQSLVLGET
ncbi:DUF1854 domain-containing protein [bacterium]|nr:DUF1854 domain-containing protein [bacterium]